MHAVVMAAGEGRRMRPISERWPKPVLPIEGRPVIGTLLRDLAAAGIERGVVVTGHLAEQVEALVGEGAAPLAASDRGGPSHPRPRRRPGEPDRGRAALARRARGGALPRPAARQPTLRALDRVPARDRFGSRDSGDRDRTDTGLDVSA